MKLPHEIGTGEEIILANGATLVKTAEGCTVCQYRNEHIELSTFMLEKEMKQIYLCDAHAEELLYLNEDKKQEGGILGEIESILRDWF